MAQAAVSSKGSIVIPHEFRQKYGIRPASHVEVLDIGGRVMILPIPKDPIHAARGLLTFKESVRRVLRESRRVERRKEKKKGW